jgi:histidine triad (HIT) family protein
MSECPFCTLAGGAEKDLLVLRTPNVLVVPALKQRRLNRGQMLILPRVHVTRMIDAEPSLIQELYTVAGRVSMAVRQAFDATGATLFQNDDAPDQEIIHLHIHVVPRRSRDEFKLPDPMIEELSREERQHQTLALQRVLN